MAATTRTGSAAGGGIARRLLRAPFGSLPARIITSVFAAALLTSFAVTWIASQSTERFLRARIDARFPEVVALTGARIERWYAQRALDIETFAASETLVESLLPAAGPGEREEARKYLAYVQEGFPQFRALFALDPSGAVRVWVGEQPPLPDTLRDTLARSAQSGPSEIFQAGDLAVQFLSAPVRTRGGTLGSLHAMIGLETAELLLRSDAVDLPAASLFLVDSGGSVLVQDAGEHVRERYERPLPSRPGPPVIDDYTSSDGERVVGAAVRLSRFGWTLVMEQSYDVAFAPVVAAESRVRRLNSGIVVVFGLLAFLIARSIARPIHALSEAARRIAEGETDVAIPASQGSDEIGVLSQALRAMVERLDRNRLELERKQQELQRKQEEIERKNAELTESNEALRRSNETLEQLSFTDSLTSLHNHRYFQDRVRVEAKRVERTGEPLALLLIDIDDFKALNDRHGHAAGDDVLRTVGRVVNVTVRQMDLPARYGGEEFVVLAPRTDEAGAIGLAEKLRREISDTTCETQGLEKSVTLRVTVSIGVALYRESERQLFNDADRALYRAKASGKDCVVTATTGR